jgi:hypothetical protein
VRDVKFPNIPDVKLPLTIHEAYRVHYGRLWNNGIVDVEPPRVGKPFPVMVPQVDQDGIDLAGIRMPEVAVPLATYTGWNPRAPQTGAPEELVDFVGSYIPFPRTKAEREQTGDPRLSIEERYHDRSHFLELCNTSANALMKEGFILAEDVPSLIARAKKYWDYATK